MCTSCNGDFKFRSGAKLPTTSELIQAYSNSSSYEAASTNFGVVSDWEKNHVYTFDETKLEALIVEKSAITTSGYSYYVSLFNSYNYEKFNTYYVNIQGNLSNLIKFSGSIDIMSQDNKKLFAATYSDSTLVSISNPMLDPNFDSGRISFEACVVKSNAEIAGNAYSALLCLGFGLQCAAGIIIHCVIESRKDTREDD